MELDHVAAEALGVEGLAASGVFSLASRAASNIAAAPQCRPKSDSAAASAARAVRRTASRSGRSLVNRSTSSKGGDWLKMSWVSKRCWAVIAFSRRPQILPRCRRSRDALWNRPLPALPRPSDSAYRGRFNEHRREDLVRPQPAPPAGDRRAFARRDHRPARPRRGIRRAQPPDREEAHLAARPHPDQPVLRSLDPHPVLVRARRQAARRRRDEHGGRQLVGEEGRDADRHRDDAQRHASRHPGGAPSCLRRGRAAGAEGRRLGGQCRRRRARASDPGAARRADHPPQQGPRSRA